MTRSKPANDDVQTVRGNVISGDRTTVIRTGPIKLSEDGTAQAEVVFDRPVSIPLSALIPDPQERADLSRSLESILTCESNRLDDIFAAGGMDPTKDLVGSDFSDSEFVGTAERPLDIRNWDLSHCDLTNSIFEHVLVDETTKLDGATLDGISGPAADLILNLQGTAPKGP